MELGVGEFVGEIKIGSARVGIDTETVSLGALVQPIRKDAIKLSATIRRYAILKFIYILQCQTKSADQRVDIQKNSLCNIST